MERKTLEKGDVLFVFRGGKMVGKAVIARTTPKRAFSTAKTQFDRDISSGKVTSIGDSGYTYTTYKLHTEELEARYVEEKQRAEILQTIKYADFTSLTLGQLRQIHAIINPL